MDVCYNYTPAMGKLRVYMSGLPEMVCGQTIISLFGSIMVNLAPVIVFSA